MQQEQLNEGAIDAVVFDVIGTLVNGDATGATVAQEISAAAASRAPTGLHKRCAKSLQQRINAVIDGDDPWQPHSRLIIESANDAIRAFGGIPTAATTTRVSTLDSEYPAWPDVTAATEALRRGGLVADFGNGSLACLARLADTNVISWDTALSSGAAQTTYHVAHTYANCRGSDHFRPVAFNIRVKAVNYPEVVGNVNTIKCTAG